MATTSNQATRTLLTAEQFMERPEQGSHELVKGEPIEVSPGNFFHNVVCARLARLLGNDGIDSNYGYALCNAAAVVTERGPDTVRGADVAFYSNARLAFSQFAPGLPVIAPDLVVEVYSPSNRPTEILKKVHEYLDAGVMLVWVVYPDRRRVMIYRPTEPIPLILSDQDVLENFPELPGFRCPVAELFD